MENQHRKITGYRELSAEEVHLMNRIKAKGAELLALQDELRVHLTGEQGKRGAALEFAKTPEESQEALAEFDRFLAAEPRCSHDPHHHPTSRAAAMRAYAGVRDVRVNH